jgi:lipoprotein signal peptidase
VLRSFVVLAGAALVIATVDLAHKASAGPVFVHERSASYAAGLGLLSFGWTVAVVLLRSPSIALAAGFLVGGAVGNGLSLAFWPGVPNPLVAGQLAFNVADLSAALGLVLFMAAVVVFAMRNRERLFEPV